MIIDFHIHYLNVEGFEDKLLREMDRCGVDKSSVSAVEGLVWMARVGSNEEVSRFVRAHPDRLLGAIYVDPRREDSRDIVRRYAGEGFKSVKMFPPAGYFPDDERWYPVYECIEEAGLPILFHTGLTSLVYEKPEGRRNTSSFYADPMRLDAVAKAFPKLNILVAHMGFPYYTEAWSVALVNKNVYLDFAGLSSNTSSPWLHGAPVVYNALGRYIPIDWNRVIWGSDNCAPQDKSMEMAKKYFLEMGCEERFFDGIFGETARKLIGI